ncbi:MAG TPA: hypothetical protein VKZ18_14480 [Polyangia bacterium]|nr:hypothetical protein [Polyangia bacterium]
MGEHLDAPSLEREAAAVLGRALARASTLHAPGERGQHRAELAQAIALAESAIAAAEADGGSPETVAAARSTLVQAHAARARDARHGAGQLSLGAQRAPTRDDCDDGWQRVEEIVGVAERSAALAAHLALLLDAPTARSAAGVAQAAARDARRLVDERNHAYTFHTDPGFSFGEGWYLAAAAVLAGVAIQIEPDQPQTAQAERFLRDAGLAALIRPYRSRPRANKHLPQIVAAAFRADPDAAQRRLRAAFLGDAPISRAVADWIDRRLAAEKTVLVWVRHGTHQPARNTTHRELVELTRRAVEAGLSPVLVGDAVQGGEPPAGAIDCTLFWKDPLFQGPDARRAQLQLYEHLRRAHGLCGQVGVTTAGMDGPALMGLPTVYLTDAPNVRLGAWVGAVPGYCELVRGDGCLAQVSRTLRRWAALRE